MTQHYPLSSLLREEVDASGYACATSSGREDWLNVGFMRPGAALLHWERQMDSLNTTDAGRRDGSALERGLGAGSKPLARPHMAGDLPHAVPAHARPAAGD